MVILISQAIQETNDTVEETVFLFGDDYDKNNLSSEKGAEGSQVCHHLSLDVRKPVFGVSDLVRHKPCCAVTEDS